MPTSEPMQKHLGKLKSEYKYRPRLRNIIPPVVFGSVLILSGIGLLSSAADYYSKHGGMAAVQPLDWMGFLLAAVLLLPGLWFIAAMLYTNLYARQGQNLQLFEEGVVYHLRGKSQAWKFDEFDGTQVLANSRITRFSGKVYSIVNYTFFVGGDRAFSVNALYPNWQQLGTPILNKVNEHVVQRLFDHIRSDEELKFDNLQDSTPFLFSRKINLTLSQQGIQQDDKKILFWSECTSIGHGVTRQQTYDPGMIWVLQAGDQAYTGFNMYTKNALIVADLIKKLHRTYSTP